MSRVEGLFQPNPRRNRRLLSLQPIDFEPKREHLREQLGSGMKLKAWFARGSALTSKFALDAFAFERNHEGRTRPGRPKRVERAAVRRDHQSIADRFIVIVAREQGDALRLDVSDNRRDVRRHVGRACKRTATAFGSALAANQGHSVIAAERSHAPGPAVEQSLPATVR